MRDILEKLLGSPGTNYVFPLMVSGKAPGVAGATTPFPAWFQDPINWHWYFEDFLFDALDLDEMGLAIYDASAAGTPTTALVADGIGGQYQVQLASTSEAETVGLYMADQLLINLAKPFLFAARVKVVHTMAANQVVILGLGSDLATTFDNITKNAWFRLDGDADILTELDDNTTDTDDQDSGEDVVAGSWYWWIICRDIYGIVHYCLIDVNGQNFRRLNKISGASLTGSAQPLLIAQKASGTTQPEIVVDAIAWMGARALT